MATMDDWAEAQEYSIELDGNGNIVDFLDHTKKRPNTPEERIRQKMGQVLCYELEYSKELMLFEAPINIGSEKRRADIVVYNSPEDRAAKNQGGIYLIAETKSPDVKREDGQLNSYLHASSSKGGFWTNGDSINFYERDRNTGVVEKTIGIPKYGQAWDSLGKYKKSELVTPIDLKLAFRRCHNAMYSSGIDSEDLAMDMTRIILAKIEDESSPQEQCDFHITQDEYSSKEGRKSACKRVRKLFGDVKERYPEVFSRDEKITTSDDQLAIVIYQLQNYAFLEAPHDVIGTAYETYVASSLKGERGQYFTNRVVINMMVRIANPSTKDIILDPCCGSGGFLLGSMDYIFRMIDSTPNSSQTKEMFKRNTIQNLFGVDIAPKLVKIAKANMLLAKDGRGGIEQGDSLKPVTNLSKSFNERCGVGKPSIILTNPPFGSGASLKVTNGDILKNYRVGHKWSIGADGSVEYRDDLNTSDGVAPEILFLEKCLQWVRTGGIVGIVMAKGQLDDRKAYAIRRYILENAKVIAVVNLHKDTFQPYCGSKASVLFLQKVDRDPGDYRIFMAISNRIGQTSRGKPIFKGGTDNQSMEIDEDLSEIADSFVAYRHGELENSDWIFSISSKDIDRESYSLNPNRYLPKYERDYNQVMEFASNPDYDIKTIGEIADKVFNGPRFTRPYADPGVTEGEGIVEYFTNTAMTQLQSNNVKYLDLNKASDKVKKQIEILTVKEGYLLVSDSGTLGRVVYARKIHDGKVVTNNGIRIVISDPALRGYVYSYLRSSIGQSIMMKSAYGTNQEHLEPENIKNMPIPIPKDRTLIERIGFTAIESIETLEKSIEDEITARNRMDELLNSNL